MNIWKPLREEPQKFYIKTLDWVSSHFIPFNRNVPLLSKQEIIVTDEMHPEQPTEDTQIHRYLWPLEHQEWRGGVPVGIIKEENQLYRLLIKQYKHRLSSVIYHPAQHKRFP